MLSPEIEEYLEELTRRLKLRGFVLTPRRAVRVQWVLEWMRSRRSYVHLTEGVRCEDRTLCGEMFVPDELVPEGEEVGRACARCQAIAAKQEMTGLWRIDGALPDPEGSVRVYHKRRNREGIGPRCAYGR